MKKIFVILGPTSSGKTTLTLDLCKRMGGEIISADSRQIYKYMDIGTGKLPINSKAKIQKQEQKWIIDDINVWGYDLITPDEHFSSYDFAVFALKKIRELIDTNKAVFLVGGTGFYIDVITGNVQLTSQKPDFERRKSLETTPTQNLTKWLKKLNPEVFKKTDAQNRVRVIRAIERELDSGTKATPLPKIENIDYKKVGLMTDREVLFTRADNWLKEIWGRALFEEIEFISAQFPETSKLNGLVYKTACAYLKGELDYEGAYARTKFDLHAYIRRQQTYMKKMPDVIWIDISQDNYKETVYNMFNG